MRGKNPVVTWPEGLAPVTPYKEPDLVLATFCVRREQGLTPPFDSRDVAH